MQVIRSYSRSIGSVSEPTRQYGCMSGRRWAMAYSDTSTPRASTPRSQNASTRNPHAQPASKTLRGFRERMISLAIPPKNSVQCGVLRSYGSGPNLFRYYSAPYWLAYSGIEDSLPGSCASAIGVQQLSRLRLLGLTSHHTTPRPVVAAPRSEEHTSEL